MFFCMFTFMPLLTERDNLVDQGYKHLAPPEQETLNKKTGLCSKPVSGIEILLTYE